MRERRRDITNTTGPSPQPIPPSVPPPPRSAHSTKQLHERLLRSLSDRRLRLRRRAA